MLQEGTSVSLRHSRRKRRHFTAIVLIIGGCCLTTCCDSFSVRGIFRRAARGRNKNHLAPPPLPATETWSGPGGAGSSGSRFGVRKRVKAVLNKARNRTRLENVNSSPSSSLSMIVAETASIGGLDDEADLVYRNGKSSSSPLQLLRNGTENDLYVLQKSSQSSLTLRSRNSSNGDQVDALLASEAGPFAVTKKLKNNQSSPKAKQETPAVDLAAPLPFTLPQLTASQVQLLQQGERIQEQSKMGRDGKGYVVLDIKAEPSVIWKRLLDFEAYPQLIPTVRSMRMFTNTHLTSSYKSEDPVQAGSQLTPVGTPSITRASFVLSKFHLNIAAIHKYQPHPQGDYMVFALDRACKNVVLQDAKGIWYTEALPDGETTRVWLLCELKCSPILPKFIVDYAAKRAMPRATSWLKPAVEAVTNSLPAPNGSSN